MKQEYITQEKETDNNNVNNKVIQEIIEFIRPHDFSKSDMKKIFSKEICELIHSKKESVPLSIFDNDKLSVLESVVKYLKENQKMKLKDIADLLNRNSKTIWTTYNNASKKMQEPLSNQVDVGIPLDLFQNRDVSPMEVVVNYLKDVLGFKNHEIANLLHRDQRTIWTTYNRKKTK